MRADLAGLGLDPFWAELAPMPGAKGRGGVGGLQVGGVELVVRPYRRGGAVARLLNDRYASPARVLAELEVLCALRQQGVAVVAPVAAVARRHGAVWRLRLCTELLQGARTLPQFMADFPEARRDAVDCVARVVRSAFDAGLRHPDLHVDNILCARVAGELQAALVDLDRSRLAPPLPERARDAMLARMQRYVVKHRASLAAVPTRAETMRLLRGVGLGRRERHRLWRSLPASGRR